MNLTIVFDGGVDRWTLGYGSFRATNGVGEELALERQKFWYGMDNHLAELHTLHAAMLWLHSWEHRARVQSVEFRGDSLIVLGCFTRDCHVPRGLLSHFNRVRNHVQCVRMKSLLSALPPAKFAWHPRKESVKALGH